MYQTILSAFILMVSFSSVQAADRTMPLSREALDEAGRLCEVNAKNDQTRYVLLTGLLEQSRFEGGAAPDWFPPNFTGHFVKTNFYPPRQKVAVHAVPSETLDTKELELPVGEPYALCVKPDEYRQGKPHFTLPHASGVYRLIPSSQQ